jgi:hypothetical protein
MQQAVMRIFSVFSRMISNLPAQAILKALEAECKMLQDDFENYRIGLSEDALSILCFGQFVKMIKTDSMMRCSSHLPPDHAEFYKETIIRLIHAGELPDSAMDQFDHAFKF